MNAIEPPEGMLPREFATGLHWLGQCQTVSYQGRILHSYNSPFLVSGDNASILVEAGHPHDLLVLDRQLDDLLADGE